MVRKAIGLGFDISPDIKERLIDRLDQVVCSENDRTAVAAGKVLVAAEAVTVRAQNGPAKHLHIHPPAGGDKPKSLAELQARLLGTEAPSGGNVPSSLADLQRRLAEGGGDADE